jgi:hypothetical protein
MRPDAPDLLARATDLRNDVPHCHAPKDDA